MDVPGEITWPRSTCRMATRPSNGARIVFLVMVAFRFATMAAVCFARASAASTSASVFAPPSRSLRALSMVVWARAASALADSS